MGEAGPSRKRARRGDPEGWNRLEMRVAKLTDSAPRTSADPHHGYTLFNAIAINYPQPDKDHYCHFLTHVVTDSTADVEDFLSTSASVIITSRLNAYILKKYFNYDKNIQPVDVGKTYAVLTQPRDMSIFFTPIKSDYNIGSVMFLFKAKCGSVLFSGNANIDPSFFEDPHIRMIQDNKIELTEAYLDLTYLNHNVCYKYDTPTIIQVLGDYIKSKKCKFKMMVPSFGFEDVLVSLALYVKEKFAVESEEMRLLMVSLGRPDVFHYLTTTPSDARIAIGSSKIVERPDDDSVEIIYLVSREEFVSQPRLLMKSSVCRGKVYVFNFFCHSSHVECAKLVHMVNQNNSAKIYNISRTGFMSGALSANVMPPIRFKKLKAPSGSKDVFERLFPGQSESSADVPGPSGVPGPPGVPGPSSVPGPSGVQTLGKEVAPMTSSTDTSLSPGALEEDNHSAGTSGDNLRRSIRTTKSVYRKTNSSKKAIKESCSCCKEGDSRSQASSCRAANRVSQVRGSSAGLSHASLEPSRSVAEPTKPTVRTRPKLSAFLEKHLSDDHSRSSPDRHGLTHSSLSSQSHPSPLETPPCLDSELPEIKYSQVLMVNSFQIDQPENFDYTQVPIKEEDIKEEYPNFTQACPESSHEDVVSIIHSLEELSDSSFEEKPFPVFSQPLPTGVITVTDSSDFCDSSESEIDEKPEIYPEDAAPSQSFVEPQYDEEKEVSDVPNVQGITKVRISSGNMVENITPTRVISFNASKNPGFSNVLMGNKLSPSSSKVTLQFVPHLRKEKLPMEGPVKTSFAQAENIVNSSVGSKKENCHPFVGEMQHQLSSVEEVNDSLEDVEGMKEAEEESGGHLVDSVYRVLEEHSYCRPSALYRRYIEECRAIITLEDQHSHLPNEPVSLFQPEEIKTENNSETNISSLCSNSQLSCPSLTSEKLTPEVANPTENFPVHASKEDTLLLVSAGSHSSKSSETTLSATPEPSTSANINLRTSSEIFECKPSEIKCAKQLETESTNDDDLEANSKKDDANDYYTSLPFRTSLFNEESPGSNLASNCITNIYSATGLKESGSSKGKNFERKGTKKSTIKGNNMSKYSTTSLSLPNRRKQRKKRVAKRNIKHKLDPRVALFMRDREWLKMSQVVKTYRKPAKQDSFESESADLTGDLTLLERVEEMAKSMYRPTDGSVESSDSDHSQSDPRVIDYTSSTDPKKLVVDDVVGANFSKQLFKVQHRIDHEFNQLEKLVLNNSLVNQLVDQVEEESKKEAARTCTRVEELSSKSLQSTDINRTKADDVSEIPGRVNDQISRLDACRPSKISPKSCTTSGATRYRPSPSSNQISKHDACRTSETRPSEAAPCQPSVSANQITKHDACSPRKASPKSCTTSGAARFRPSPSSNLISKLDACKTNEARPIGAALCKPSVSANQITKHDGCSSRKTSPKSCTTSRAARFRPSPSSNLISKLDACKTNEARPSKAAPCQSSASANQITKHDACSPRKTSPKSCTTSGAARYRQSPSSNQISKLDVCMTSKTSPGSSKPSASTDLVASKRWSSQLSDSLSGDQSRKRKRVPKLCCNCPGCDSRGNERPSTSRRVNKKEACSEEVMKMCVVRMTEIVDTPYKWDQQRGCYLPAARASPSFTSSPSKPS